MFRRWGRRWSFAEAASFQVLVALLLYPPIAWIDGTFNFREMLMRIVSCFVGVLLILGVAEIRRVNAETKPARACASSADAASQNE